MSHIHQMFVGVFMVGLGVGLVVAGALWGAALTVPSLAWLNDGIGGAHNAHHDGTESGLAHRAK